MRYFFNICMAGEEFPDREGTELVSEDAAQREARKIARELGENFCDFIHRRSVVEVLSETGKRIFALPLNPRA